MTRDALADRVGLSGDVLDAALRDLRLDGNITENVGTCAECGRQRIMLRRH